MTTPTYATLAELKTRLQLKNDSGQFDAELTLVLSAAARRIDRDCGRRFYADGAPSARVYDITHPTKLIVDDISTSTGLVVAVGSGTSFSTVDSSLYVLKPENALAKGDAVWLLDRVFGYWWPWGYSYQGGFYARWQVQVTASWGWPSVPDPIHDANLLLAHRLWKRRDSPEGVAGFNDLGTVRVSRYDPDYDALIAPFVRQEF